MARALIYLQIKMYTLANTKKVFHQVMVNTDGRVELATQESSKMEKRKARESGRKMRNQLIATSIQASTTQIKSMDKASLTGKMEITIKELTIKTRGTDMVRCFGLTAPNTKVNGNLVLSTDKVNFGYQMGTIKKDCLKITFMLVKWDKLKI